MNKGLIMSLVLLAVMASASVSAADSTRETRNVSGFSRIGFGVAGDLYITIGQEFSVVLEGDRDLLKQVETEVSGSKLVIKRDNWHSFGNERLTVYVTMPAIDGLSVSGSGKAEIKDAVKAEELHFSVSGSGRITTGALNLSELKVEISGSGSVFINGSGEAKESDISISGSGSYSGESLQVEEAEFSISGSGSARCNVTGSLKAGISGSGNVVYSGSPKIDARVSGSGKVRSK